MEIYIRQDAVLDALVVYQMTGSISDDHIDAAIEALQQYQAIEDKNRQLREALADIKMLPLNYSATTALPKIVYGMTDATYEHGILRGFSVAADIARTALQEKEDE
jgi:predicted metal-dependent peptidase